MSESLQCARSACKEDLTGKGHVKIYNLGHTGSYRVYCSECANKILYANRQMVAAKQTDITLKHETVVAEHG